MSKHNGALKAKRQQAIVGMVSRGSLASQEEIRVRLAAIGIDATQSTISRDVEELGLARIHDHAGTRYAMPGEAGSYGPVALLRHLMDEFVLAFVTSSAGLIVRTSPGAAAAVAEGIDRAGSDEIAGTIAGDNTILVLGREGVSSHALERSLTSLREG